MKFTVVIPAYCAESFIAESIESVLFQSFGSYELIVVDDGSDDGTYQVALEYAKNHENVRVYHKENGGVSSARNYGVTLARGEYIAFLDADDMYEPGYLQSVFDELTSKTMSPDVIAHGALTFDGRSSKTGVLRSPSDGELLALPQINYTRCLFIPSATVVSRQMMQRVEGFDEDPRIQHAEDWDLWIRIAEMGGQFKFIKKNLVKYREHSDQATANSINILEKSVYCLLKNKDFTLMNNMEKSAILSFWLRKLGNAQSHGSRLLGMRTLFKSLSYCPVSIRTWIRLIGCGLSYLFLVVGFSSFSKCFLAKY